MDSNFSSQKPLLNALDEFSIAKNRGEDPSEKIPSNIYSQVIELLKRPDQADHPLVKEYISMINKFYK
jgi:hypothetical protein